MKIKISNFALTAVIIVIAYYLCVLPHEWSHGLLAWIFGYKTSAFDIKYGGYLLLHCDEHVPYNKILASGLGYQAAIIGIAGMSYNAIVFAISLFCLQLKKIRKNVVWHKVFYWFAVFNLCPIIGYIPNNVFSSQGDIGRFISGFQLSPWLIFVPGTIIVAYLVYYLIGKKMYELFVDLNITNIMLKRLYLWFTVFILFFLIYTHGYNPFSDAGALVLNKIIAAVSIVIALSLLILFDPRYWRQIP